MLSSVTTTPPLSRNLRASPPAADIPFGGSGEPDLSPECLIDRSFCLRVSGAVAPSAALARSLPIHRNGPRSIMGPSPLSRQNRACLADCLTLPDTGFAGPAQLGVGRGRHAAAVRENETEVSSTVVTRRWKPSWLWIEWYKAPYSTVVSEVPQPGGRSIWRWSGSYSRSPCGGLVTPDQSKMGIDIHYYIAAQEWATALRKVILSYSLFDDWTGGKSVEAQIWA